MNKKVVSVIGQSRSTPEQDAQAHELGKRISESGYVIVCGGKGGVMQAVARGAAESGGMCIGLLPGYDRSEGNPFLTMGIPTGLGHARNMLVVRAGDIVVAIGGGYGTLSEIAFALTMGKVVIGLNSWTAVSHAGVPAEVLAVRSADQAMKYINKHLSD